MQGPAFEDNNSFMRVPHLNNSGCGILISRVITVLELVLIYYGC